MATLERVVIFDEVLYRANGDVHKWCRKITDTFERFTVHYAPERSGELKAGITASTHQTGIRQVQGIIASRARHTTYVLRGTTGPIRTRRGFADPLGGIRVVHGPNNRLTAVRVKGYWMRIPAHGGHGEFFAREVSGQRAQNFFEQAWRATARNHTAIRGVLPDVIRNP